MVAYAAWFGLRRAEHREDAGNYTPIAKRATLIQSQALFLTRHLNVDYYARGARGCKLMYYVWNTGYRATHLILLSPGVNYHYFPEKQLLRRMDLESSDRLI